MSFITPDEKVICYADHIVKFPIYGINTTLVTISRYIGTKGHPKVRITSKYSVESCEVTAFLIQYKLPKLLLKVSDCYVIWHLPACGRHHRVCVSCRAHTWWPCWEALDPDIYVAFFVHLSLSQEWQSYWSWSGFMHFSNYTHIKHLIELLLNLSCWWTGTGLHVTILVEQLDPY